MGILYPAELCFAHRYDTTIICQTDLVYIDRKKTPTNMYVSSALDAKNIPI